MSAWVDCSCGDTHWGPDGAAGLLLTTTDRTYVLLQQRSPLVDQPGTWGIPSGAIDSDEWHVDAALREAVEENALAADQAPAILGTIPGHTTPEWSFTYVVAELPEAEPLTGGGGWEATQTRWVPTDQVPALTLHPSLAADWPDLHSALANTSELPPLYGWRAWSLGTDADGPVLTSPFVLASGFTSTVYTTGPVMTARCLGYLDHEPPAPGCECGVYAMLERESLWLWCQPADVIACVRLHPPMMLGGEYVGTFPGEVRAAAATITGPAFVSPGLAAHAPALADRYGVEFTPDPELDEGGPDGLTRLALSMMRGVP